MPLRDPTLHQMAPAFVYYPGEDGRVQPSGRFGRGLGFVGGDDALPAFNGSGFSCPHYTHTAVGFDVGASSSVALDDARTSRARLSASLDVDTTWYCFFDPDAPYSPTAMRSITLTAGLSVRL